MNLLFRADSSIQIGTGHVMRCIALAQAWQDAGGLAWFAMAETTPAIQARLEAESCAQLSITAGPGTSADASQTIALAQKHQASWIVVDGYQFDADYQRLLKAAGCRTLFIDDYGHAARYSADMVLNQNVNASASLYFSREPQTRLLLGPRYCLLRREFSAWRDWKREVPSVCGRILVMMGGSDPENLTGRVIEALALVEAENLEITVVVGGSNPHADTLRTCAADSGLNITVERDVSNIAELMAAADVAISAAGSTCWELCLMGLPALLIDVADNQTELASDLDRRGCAIHAGGKTVSPEKIGADLKRLLGTHELRQSLAQRSRQLVDGNGAARVISALRGVPRLRLRQARPGDSRLLFEWANDPDVRAASFSAAPIPWESHVAWFGERLRGSGIAGRDRSLILIAEDEVATPVGQIRFEATADDAWEVDVSVAGAVRGRGLGSELIRLGVQELLRHHRGARVHAFVKPANTASVKAFEDADFKLVGTEQTRGHAAIHLICEEAGPLNR
jgi:UDP-2,4-diacetamido-2,4,6-trideoxy-beta-L-altropyranose hydrolase